MKSIMVFSMICYIFFPAQFFNIHFQCFKFVNIVTRFYFTAYFNSDILLLPSFSPFYLLLSSYYLHFKFSFLSRYSFFLFHTPTFSPPSASQNQFSCQRSSHILFPALKIPHSLSTFSNLCSLVVDRLAVVEFLQFYLQISTILVFQI